MKVRVSKKALAFARSGALMTVDPGLGGLGWAVWYPASWGRLAPPDGSGTIRASKALVWIDRARRQAESLAELVRRWDVSCVVIELPMLYQGERGRKAARRGDLVKLSVATGAYLGALPPGVEAEGVTAPAWKGSLDDAQVNGILQTRLPDWLGASESQHERDAVGLGLFLKGKL